MSVSSLSYLHKPAVALRFGQDSAIQESLNTSRAASSEGFNWPSADHFFSALARETQEFVDETLLQPPSQRRLHEELGDMLLCVVKLGDFFWG